MQPQPPPPPPGYGWPPGPNPYAGYPPPKTNTPRTLGTLSMVFGGIVTGTSLLTLVVGKSLGTFSAPPGHKAAFERYAEQCSTYSMVTAAVMLLMSVALFYFGTGQRKYLRWAAKASVQWGVVALLVLVGQFIGIFAVVLPAIDDLTRAVANDRVLGSMSTMMKVTTVFSLALYAPFPLILISTFRKQENIDAMDQPAAELPSATVRRS
jgi:hypothetical protein